MKKTTSMDNAKLGLFVMAGLVFLIFSLYMIGRNRSLFGSTFTITASFSNVNGLVPGNNVRYSGIDVGTVDRIQLINDTVVHVSMLLDQDVRQHIRQNAIASIGTDGLMGNKIISIKSQPGDAPIITDGGFIQSRIPVETDAMLQLRHGDQLARYVRLLAQLYVNKPIQAALLLANGRLIPYQPEGRSS